MNHQQTVEPTLNDASDLAEILAAEYRYSPLFKDDVYAKEMLVHIARTVLKDTGQDERFSLRIDGVLSGVISRRVRLNGSFGCRVTDLFIALLPNVPAVLHWARSILGAMDWHVEHTIVGRISAYHQYLLPVLADLGVGIDAVGLVSSTDSALNRLRSHYELPEDFRGLGLRHTVMEPGDLDEVIELRRRAFTLAPQYCWFGAQPAHLEFQYQRLEKDLAGNHAWWVIRNDQKLVGTFGSSITMENPMWGPVGGMELIFDTGYVSKGMSKIAYALTLSKLAQEGCSVFKGITAQAPVMHLGKIMGRALFDIHLRGPSDFEPTHFSLYLHTPVCTLE